MKKVEFKDKSEMITRLVAGEVFCNLIGLRLEFSEDGNFRFGDSLLPINACGIYGWYTKPRWDDNLSEENPVLCWISDISPQKRSYAAFVTDKNKITDKYKSDGTYWVYATPVKPDECWSES